MKFCKKKLEGSLCQFFRYSPLLRIFKYKDYKFEKPLEPENLSHHPPHLGIFPPFLETMIILKVKLC